MLSKLFILLFLFTQYVYSNDFLELHHKISRAVSEYYVDVEGIKSLIDSGVDLNKRNQFGATALSNAVESWAYISYVPSASIQMKEVILYILNSREDIDVSTPENRGVSPLYGMFRWGNWGAQEFDEIVNEILIRDPDMNIKSYEGLGIQLFAVFGLVDNYLEDFMNRGMSFDGVMLTGENYLHYGIRNKNLLMGEVQAIEFISKSLSASTLKKYKNMKDGFGFTPLHYGARSGSLDGVKYLIETLEVKKSLSNSEGKTPLDIAYDNSNTEVIEYLELVGAKRGSTSSELSCENRNEHLDVNFESVQKLVAECKIKKIEKLLKILPASYLGYHTLSYATLAAMDASASHPMVTTYGNDGKFMMSFNGDHHQDGYQKLDIIQFRDESKKFEMRQVTFPDHGHGEVKYSRANPANCLSCHGSSPRPLWDSWTFWPGKFRGESGSIHPIESEKYEKFLKNRNKGRYKHIPGLSPEPLQHFVQNERMGKAPNVTLDILTEGLVSEMIGREIKETSTLYKNRYSILAGLSCNEDISEFIPESLKNGFRYSRDFYKRETLKATKGEFVNRYNLLEEFLEAPGESRYAYNQFYVNPRESGRNFSLEQTVSLRYLIEELGHSMNHWFTPFNNGQGTSYVRFDWAVVEWATWKELITEESDPELFNYYQTAKNNAQLYTIEAVPYLFYNTSSAEQKGACEIIKSKITN